MNEQQARRMSRARERLLKVDPFWGWPSMLLQMRERKVGTMCTDGTHLDYDAAWTAEQTEKHLIFEIAHEVGHNILLHPFRINGRNHKLANEAGDYAVNEILDKGRIGQMADGLLRDRRFDGMSLETIFAILWSELQKKLQDEQPDLPQDSDDEPEGDEGQTGGLPGGDESDDDADDDSDESGDDGDQPGDDADDENGTDETDESGDQPCGDESDDEDGDADGDGEDEDLTDGGTRSYFVPAPQPEAPRDAPEDGEVVPDQASATEQPLTADDWKEIAAQAVMIAARAGNLPGGADLAVQASRESVLDWKAVLREFVVATIPSEYSWSSPNRRFISQEWYLPGVHKENTGYIVVAVDTSGSTRQLLPRFGAEVNSVFNETRPERVSVPYCDAEVLKVDEFEQDEEIVFAPVGGGGTRFQPVFDWVAEQNEQPVCLIYLTDMEGDHPTEPDYPVLWVTTEAFHGEAPFGTLVKMPVGVWGQ